MTKLGTSGRTAFGLWPNVLHAVLGGLQDCDRFGSAKRAALVFKDFGQNFLTRQYVANKNHSAFVTRNEDAAVGNLLDVEG